MGILSLPGALPVLRDLSASSSSVSVRMSQGDTVGSVGRLRSDSGCANFWLRKLFQDSRSCFSDVIDFPFMSLDGIIEGVLSCRSG